jgi:hypothetical protein
MNESPRPSPKLAVLLATVVGVALAQAAILVLLITGVLALPMGGTTGDLTDPVQRSRVIQDLIDKGQTTLDSHPDRDVGRVLAPSTRWTGSNGLVIESNRVGMREKDYALPKPAGVVRIVVLGDSFVYGSGVAAEDRVSRRLEERLRSLAHLPEGGDIECLGLGVASWNLVNECSYLRRQLSLLQPDLVVHVTFMNDLNDSAGVRGFGALAGFSPAHAQRADVLIESGHPRNLMDQATDNWLHLGIDHESSQRFGEAFAAMRELRAALGQLDPPADYLVVVNWAHVNPLFRHHAAEGLRSMDGEVVYVPASVHADETLWVATGPGDTHWNRKGADLIAELICGWILDRGWLRRAGIEAQPDLVDGARRVAEQGLAEASAAARASALALVRDRIAPTIDFEHIDPKHAAQVFGGIDGQGYVGPYAIFVLRNPARENTLVIEAERLGDPGIRSGASLTVHVEGEAVGTLSLAGSGAIVFRADLPDSIRGREYMAIRLTSTDYVYRGDELRHCVSLRLMKAGLR